MRLALKQESCKYDSNSNDYEKVVSQVSTFSGLSEFRTEKLKRHKTARLIGLLPFIAGCENAKRTSAMCLTMYLYAMFEGKEDFNHSLKDDESISARMSILENAMLSDGGCKKIIRIGMSLLELQMISGYKRDIEKDKEKGKYNPFTFSKWDYSSLESNLETFINENRNSEILSIMDVNDAKNNFWILV